MIKTCRIVVLISGNGSNLQAIIDAISHGQISGQVVTVISDQAEAYGLQRARQADISTEILDYTGFKDRQTYDHALMGLIDSYQPDLVVLAGFMRILSDEFVTHYLGRLVNIHPSLLPKFKGLNTHRRVLTAGEKEHGATVHFVIPELDSGPIILQAKLELQEKETEQELTERIHQIEHKIYPKAIAAFTEGRLVLSDGKVLLDNQILNQTFW